MKVSNDFVGKPSNTEEHGSNLNKVEEQFENIKLTRDSTERLPMENMLGQWKVDLLK